MPFFKSSLAGPGYIILNAIRVINIITLISVIIASAVMLVKTFVVSKFFFFDGVSHVVTAFLGIFLIITETPLFRSYVAKNWPLLSPSSGFVTLGFMMIIVGVSILGNLNKQATSQESLGTHYWSIVIASGILSLILGVVNLFASYIFRSRKLGLTARMVRSHGAVAQQKALSSSASSSSRRRSFHLGRHDSLPIYNSNHTENFEPKRNISAPLTGVAIGQPDLAHHPAMTGGRI